MRFWRSIPGAVVLVSLLGTAAGFVMAAVQVQRLMHPARTAAAEGDLGAELARVDEVSFASADGVPLAGWLLHGAKGRAPVILCHDLGENKSALINLAIALNREGLTVLTFDFRGHGASGGGASTLGIDEARDVTGAVDFVATLPKGEVDGRAIGIFGAGMGAHAAVLAAADRPALRVLVLDGLWPDVRWRLVRGALPDWSWGQDHVGGVPMAMFALLSGSAPSSRRAADVLPELAGRDLLLVSPAGDGRLDDAMKAMYATLPERRDSERNLITLPATRASGLSADELARYHKKVVDFFVSRLSIR
ncbi:MAG TPA: alpha/beta hydrolase [Candidatus Polarisedimenticolaceae bacterium]|nr:alpha/beta hydrolase [Candidatus Polarisedimenticolaceae bacterium]